MIHTSLVFCFQQLCTKLNLKIICPLFFTFYASLSLFIKGGGTKLLIALINITQFARFLKAKFARVSTTISFERSQQQVEVPQLYKSLPLINFELIYETRVNYQQPYIKIIIIITSYINSIKMSLKIKKKNDNIQ